MARIVWHEAGFVGIHNEVVRYISRLGDRVLNAAEAGCPVDSGALKNSLRKDMEGTTAVISANTDYAIYVEEGAGPHIMSNGPYFWEGASHPVDVVHHPGNEATHFLRNALYSVGGG